MSRLELMSDALLAKLDALKLQGNALFKVQRFAEASEKAIRDLSSPADRFAAISELPLPFANARHDSNASSSCLVMCCVSSAYVC